MIFSSWLFAVFFIVVYGVYWTLPDRRWRHPFLLIASYIFYMSWNPWLVTIIMSLSVFDFSVGLLLERTRTDHRRKLLLTASLVANLGVLAVFKYADFFILSLRELLTGVGIHTNLHTLSIILPIGISFHTFQTMSYTIDVYRGKIRAERSLADFALFVAFFPQLVAGPIVKACDFLPQLATEKRFNWPGLQAGIVLFLVGLTKKLLIADQLATLVDPVFADPTRYVTRDLWLAMFCYGGQIYCDFSGYTDMAIAVAGVLGFHLPRNFANPYLAVGLTDFWHRWHISLSSWLREYLYIPLGGSRGGRLLTYRNLMITMLLGGLWHGASWTFVVWGGIHGAALIVSKLVQRGSDGVMSWIERSARTAAGWIITLLVVHIAWVFFRCQPIVHAGSVEPESATIALNRAVYIVTHLFIPAQVGNPIWLMNKVPMMALLGLMAAMQLYDEWVLRGHPRLRLPAPIAGVGYAAWILALVVLSPENTSPFIYFQF
ncbi:MAG TPA: MBOAT family O-acyltransferase [Phycisphaerae bacterium]|nr:MBOAT family O-acyltransferase [Phycisphaerae bacterium]